MPNLVRLKSICGCLPNYIFVSRTLDSEGSRRLNIPPCPPVAPVLSFLFSAIQAVSTSVSVNASRVTASVSANATRVISEIKADLFSDRELANRSSKEVENPLLGKPSVMSLSLCALTRVFSSQLDQ